MATYLSYRLEPIHKGLAVVVDTKRPRYDGGGNYSIMGELFLWGRPIGPAVDGQIGIKVWPRRKGLGSFLLYNFIENYKRSSTHKYLAAVIDNNNKASQALFQKFGFKKNNIFYPSAYVSPYILEL